MPDLIAHRGTLVWCFWNWIFAIGLGLLLQLFLVSEVHVVFFWMCDNTIYSYHDHSRGSASPEIMNNYCCVYYIELSVKIDWFSLAGFNFTTREIWRAVQYFYLEMRTERSNFG